MLNLVIYTIAGENNYAKLNAEETEKLRVLASQGDDIIIKSVQPYRRGMKVNLSK